MGQQPPIVRLPTLDAMLTALPSWPRPVLTRLVARMIERLDELDGDPDVELNGDELDGSMAEDDFHHQHANWLGYPGDPDDAEDDLEDCCAAGDDAIRSGVSPNDHRQIDANEIGNEDDEEQEDGHQPEGARKSREAHRRRIRTTHCRAVYYRRHRWNGMAARGSLDVDHYELIAEPRVPSIRTLRRRYRNLRPGRRRR